MRKLILIIAGCFLVFYLIGQTRTFYEHGYKIEHYTEKDGLPSFHVGGITQDKNGYLWITCSSGFLRYDGYDFKRFNIGKNVITNNVKDHLHENLIDDAGNIWITTGGGIIRFDSNKNTFERYSANTVEDDAIFTIFQDSLHQIWYGSLAGILQMTPERTVIQHKMKSIEQELNPVLDSLKRKTDLYQKIINVENGKTEKLAFNLSENKRISIICNSRMNKNGKLLDFGWLENENGEKIWSVDLKESLNTGGDFMVNRTNIDFLNLVKGKYELVFTKDDSNSLNFYNKFASKATFDLPKWQGVQIIETSPSSENKLQQLIADYHQRKGLLNGYDLGLFKDKEGHIWYFSGEPVQFGKVDIEKGILEQPFCGQPLIRCGNQSNNFIDINAIADYDETHLWIGGKKLAKEGEQQLSLSLYNKKTNEFKAFKSGLPIINSDYFTISTLKMDADGNLWIGTISQGLFKLASPFIPIGEEGTPNITHFHFGYDENFVGQYGNPRNIYCQFLDENQNLWIGTQIGGMYKIDLKAPIVQLTDLSNIIEDGRFLNMVEDQIGNVWIGTESKGLIQYNIKREEINQYNTTFKEIGYEKPIAPILILQNENVLFGTKNKLIEYNPKTDLIIKTMPRPYIGRPGLYYGGFIINDTLAFVFPNYIIHTEKWKIQEQLSNPLKGKYFLHGKKSSRKGFWLAGNYGSVIQLCVNRQNLLDTVQIFDSEVYIDDIVEVSSGNPWITSGYGLQEFQKDSLLPITFSKSEDEIVNLTGSMLLDDKENIWVFSLSAVSKFDLKERKLYRIPELNEINIVNVPNNYSIKNKKGKFRILGKKGLYTFHPDSLPIDLIAPKSIIRAVNYTDGEEEKRKIIFNHNFSLKFNHHQNDFIIEFLGINFNNSERISYAYQMEGLSEDWQFVGKERTARFLDLPPGNYTFKVKAANADGIWSEPKSLQITIHPPWWQTWWAYILYAVAAIGSLWWYIQSLNKKLAKEQAHNQELTDLNEANQRFVPNDFLQILGKKSIKDLKLGDQVATKMTVLFSDIRDYTPLSESMTPEQNFKFINAYLGRVGPIIKAHGGFISSYLGDGFMALFVNEPENALKASIAAQKELEHYNQERNAKGLKSLRTGMGLNTGDLMLGVIGDEHRYESTVISDAVNTASRMEGLTKVFGAAIILSERTMEGVKHGDFSKSPCFASRYLGKVKVKGKDKAIKIYDLYEGEPIAIRQLKAKTHLQFEQGIAHYYQKEFGKAAECFKQVLAVNESDKAAQYYLDKSVGYIVNGVSADWSGVEEMVMK